MNQTTIYAGLQPLGQPTYLGMPVLVSTHAVETKPVRPHRKRTHRDSYHRRIAKKWRKRFGTRTVPAMHLISGHSLGLASTPDTLVIHPELWDRLSKEVAGE